MSNSIIKINTENFNSNINLDIPIMNKESTPVETIKYAPETAYWDKSSNVETLDLGLDSNFQEITLIKTDLEYNELVDSRISELENEITIYNSALDILDEELIRLRDIKTTVENSNTKTVATNYNAIYQEIISKDNLDKIILESYGDEFQSYDDLIKAINELENQKTEMNSLIYINEQEIKATPYNYILLKEDYQNYQSTNEVNIENLSSCITTIEDAWGAEVIETVSYTKYCELYGEVSLLDFVTTVLEKYPNATINTLSYDKLNITDIPNGTYLTNLLTAIKGNSEFEKMYNYIYDKEGINAANKYLVNMENQINQTAGEVKAVEFLKSLKEEPNPGEALLNHLITSGKGLEDGIESFGAGIAAWFESSDVISVDEYESMCILQALYSQKEKKAMGIIDDNGKSTSNIIDYTKDYTFLFEGTLVANYQISQSIGNMLPSMTISMLTMNPTIGAISLGISSGGNSYHSALTEGYRKEIAVLYGVLQGASEALLERFLGKIPGLGDVNVTSFKTLLKSAGQEGLEEFVQTYISAGFDEGILGKKINYEEIIQESFKNGAYGFVTGGIMNSVGLGMSTYNRGKTNKAISIGITTEEELVTLMKFMHPEETSNLTNQQILEQYNAEVKQIVDAIKTQNERASSTIDVEETTKQNQLSMASQENTSKTTSTNIGDTLISQMASIIIYSPIASKLISKTDSKYVTKIFTKVSELCSENSINLNSETLSAFYEKFKRLGMQKEFILSLEGYDMLNLYQNNSNAKYDIITFLNDQELKDFCYLLSKIQQQEIINMADFNYLEGYKRAAAFIKVQNYFKSIIESGEIERITTEQFQNLSNNQVLDLAENANLADLLYMYTKLTETQQKYLYENLDVLRGLVLKINTGGQVDNNEVKLFVHSINTIIEQLKQAFGEYFSTEKIEHVQTLFYPPKIYETKFGKDSNGIHCDGKCYIKYSTDGNINQQMDTAVHEIIHDLGANYYYHGIIGYGDSNLTGLNEILTEYLTEIVRGNEYCTNSNAYQKAVQFFKRLVNAEIFNIENIKQSYFSHNLSYFQDKIESLGVNFNEFVNLFNAAQYGSQESINNLDLMITELIFKNALIN